MQKVCFNQGWHFQLGDSDAMRMDTAGLSGTPIDVPHDWSMELERDPASPMGVNGGFFIAGRAWYRKRFDAPAQWKGKKIAIEFEGVYMNASVWMNDHFIGRHPYGYTTFQYDLTPYVKCDSANIIRVLVDNDSQRNSRWYSGSGIYRPVWLLISDPVHVGYWGVCVTTPSVTSAEATVDIKTRIENETDAPVDATLVSYLVDPDGSPAGETQSAVHLDARGSHESTHHLIVKKPRLWSPDTPALYRLKSEVHVAGRIVDTVKTPFGIRTLLFDAVKGFQLNGVPLKIKGGCVHHDNGILGSVSLPRAEERKVELHKASGFNAIRCAHNPPAPAFLDACDRLGMLVIDEAFDCWRDGKTTGDYHVTFDDWWQRDIESMVFRDRHHPSVILWSIGNELVERGRPEGATIAKMLADYVRALDPTRPVTAAMCPLWGESAQAWEGTADIFSALDVAGYNYLVDKYETDHAKHPRRIIAATETFPKEAFSYWMAVLDHPYIIGDFVWTSLDYLGESGIGRTYFEDDKFQFLGDYPWHQAHCGDFDICGFKRPQSYYRDILWNHGRPLYVAVHHPVPADKKRVVTGWGWPEVDANWTWPGHENAAFTVDIYSACEKVELFLNGQSLGLKPTSRAEQFIATYTVPYQPGTLKTVGYKGDRPVDEFCIETAGPPAKIRVSPDRFAIRIKGDLCYITVEIVDAQGRINPWADNTLSFSIKGEGLIAAVGNSNPVSTENYRGNQRKAYQGRCLVAVKSKDVPGEITLRVESDNLECAEMTVPVQDSNY